MEETTKKQLGEYFSQLISKAEWHKPQEPSANTQGNSIAVARAPETSLTVPARRIQGYATIGAEVPAAGQTVPTTRIQGHTVTGFRAPVAGLTVPSIRIQEHATTGARAPIAGLTVPPTRKQGHTTAEVHKGRSLTRQRSITGDEWHATAKARELAPAAGLKRQFSSIEGNSTQELPLNHLLEVDRPNNHTAAIDKMKGVVEQIPKPIYEDRIKDFVKGKRFKTWLTSKSSDALLVNNDLVNLSPGAKTVSLLTELTLLLHDKLSILPKDQKAFTLMYLCAEYPATIGGMTTVRRMLGHLTSQHYDNDIGHWNKQEFVHKYIRYIRTLKTIREENPAKGQEKIYLLSDLFIEMLAKAQPGQVIYILIDGFDLIETDEQKVNKSDYWWFLTCFYSLIEELRKPKKPCPIIKLLITYHKACQHETRSYWKNYVVDLPKPKALENRRTP